MSDMSWVSEVRQVPTNIGYTDETQAQALENLNQLLADGWKILAIINDKKYWLEFKCSTTNSYYIIGR